jgi:hypothetical protein
VIVEATLFVVTVKDAEDDPAGIVTLEGTDEPLVEERLTTAPPVPAGVLKVIVPVAETPPTSSFGLRVSPLIVVEGLIVRVAVWVTPNVALILAVWVAATLSVLTVKVAEVVPAAMLTDAGTVAFVLLDARATETPPVGAALLSVTVPVDVAPASTVVGANVRPATLSDVIVSVAVLVAPNVPESVAVCEPATAVVPIVNVADDELAGTVTDAGTVAALLFEERVTKAPPVGAGLVKVTVPVADVPPKTAAGATVTLAKVGGGGGVEYSNNAPPFNASPYVSVPYRFPLLSMASGPVGFEPSSEVKKPPPLKYWPK